MPSEPISIVDEETGKELICTPDHLIYTKNRGYIRCDNLNENDVLDIINWEYLHYELFRVYKHEVIHYGTRR